MVKKTFILTLLIGFSLALAACQDPEDNGDDDLKKATFQKTISRVSQYENSIPHNYELIDYKERAIDFDRTLFDSNLTGEYLPLIWDDETYDSFGFGAYVGDHRSHDDGGQEGVSAISAVLSATLVGIDKSDDNGNNYVRKLNAFFNDDQEVVLNRVNTESLDDSLWYKIYPGILYTQVSLLYPEEETMRENTLKNIESWYQAYKVMDNNGNPNYEYTSFDFTEMEPYYNDVWIEPDSAVGIAMFMYYGYQMTGEEKYLDALKDTMTYIAGFFGSPMYELLLYYAPFLAGYLNAEHDMDLDVSGLVDDIFDGKSIPRGGWGKIVGQWGNYPMDGLHGSIRDRDGFAFSMNTFAAAFTIPSFTQYHPDYASSMGQWMLHLVSNSRYYFPDQTDSHYQSCTDSACEEFNEIANNSFPYEGIINGFNARTPWFGGDPLIHDWAATDLSVYSGAATGMLASMIESTNVESILKININTFNFASDAHETFLLYNPYDEAKTVEYVITSDLQRDLFDLVSKETLATNVEGSIEITIDAGDSVLITELPADETITHENNRYYDSNGDVLTMDSVNAVIANHEGGSSVSGAFEIIFDMYSSIDNDTIASIEVSRGNDSFTFENTDTASLNVEDFETTGTRRLDFKITTESGLVYTFSQIFRLE